MLLCLADEESLLPASEKYDALRLRDLLELREDDLLELLFLDLIELLSLSEYLELGREFLGLPGGSAGELGPRFGLAYDASDFGVNGRLPLSLRDGDLSKDDAEFDLFDLDGLTEPALSGLGGLLGPLTNLFSGVAELLFTEFDLDRLGAESGLLGLSGLPVSLPGL